MAVSSNDVKSRMTQALQTAVECLRDAGLPLSETSSVDADLTAVAIIAVGIFNAESKGRILPFRRANG